MAPGHATSARDSQRICALTIGLAATVISWTFVAAFAPEELDSVAHYSAWLYGPASAGAWALFSAIAYLVVRRDGRRVPAQNAHEVYRCRELRVEAQSTGGLVCANENEKTLLAAVTGGFALTISTWVAMLSFMPEVWLEWLGESPAWICCLASITLWAVFSRGMYSVLRALAAKPR